MNTITSPQPSPKRRGEKFNLTVRGDDINTFLNESLIFKSIFEPTTKDTTIDKFKNI